MKSDFAHLPHVTHHVGRNRQRMDMLAAPLAIVVAGVGAHLEQLSQKTHAASNPHAEKTPVLAVINNYVGIGAAVTESKIAPTVIAEAAPQAPSHAVSGHYRRPSPGGPSGGPA